MSTYGNDNLAFADYSQSLTIDGSSDFVTIPKTVQAVSVESDVACWIVIGGAGESLTIAAPSAEKTETRGFHLPASQRYDVPIPAGSDSKLVKVYGIQMVGAGTLYVTYRTFG